MTKENEEKKYIGWTDVTLSKKGEAELRQSAGKTGKHKKVFSSPLTRCIQTAEILYPNQKVNFVPHLKEMHFGLFEGKTYAQLKDEKAYTDWLTDPFFHHPPGGESFADFAERVDRGWKQVVEDVEATKASSAVIITHGGVIRQLLSVLTSARKSFFAWDIPYGGGYELIWTNGALGRLKHACHFRRCL
jgi:alpha-ribazole phosphatase